MKDTGPRCDNHEAADCRHSGERSSDDNMAPGSQAVSREKLFYQGKPLRVLSTSLGIALVANLLLSANALGEPGAAASSSDKPQLVEWSTEAVKAYFDPNVDWNIPFPVQGDRDDKEGESAAAGSAGNGGPGGGPVASGPIVVNNGGGFGWDDLLLYHLIFNSGRTYAPSAWSTSHPVTDYRTNQPYRAKSFDSEAFRNQPTAGSTVRPKTSSSSSTFTTKSGSSGSVSSSKPSSSSSGGIGGSSGSVSSSKPSSSSPGGIGGSSKSFSSSGSHSSSSSFGS